MLPLRSLTRESKKSVSNFIHTEYFFFFNPFYHHLLATWKSNSFLHVVLTLITSRSESFKRKYAEEKMWTSKAVPSIFNPARLCKQFYNIAKIKIVSSLYMWVIKHTCKFCQSWRYIEWSKYKVLKVRESLWTIHKFLK